MYCVACLLKTNVIKNNNATSEWGLVVSDVQGFVYK